MINPQFKELKRHIGHKIVCTFYGKGGLKRNMVNVSVECETCSEVLRSEDKEQES